MKSEMHQRAFFSVRMLLQETGHTDLDLYYDEFGKPHLQEKYISITHSHSAISISDEAVGIDIELQRDKIIRIADKFCDSEFQYLNTDSDEYIRILTVIWEPKKPFLKLETKRNQFQRSYVEEFHVNSKLTTAKLHFNNLVKNFNIHFEEIEDFTLVYAFEN
jgi:phosphopantetheinyl transferase